MTDFPPALAHGELKEIFPDIFIVEGAMTMGRFGFGRVMTVIRQGEALTLVNAVRLDEAGLAALDALGRVESAMRIGAHHDRDNAFYVDRYGAKLYGLPGFSSNDVTMVEEGDSPIADARLIRLESSETPEAVLFLPREGGIVISCDCLQNWAKPDAFTPVLSRIAMRFLGFYKPANIGPVWLKRAKAKRADFERIVATGFDTLLPAHGAPIIGGASGQVSATLKRVFGAA